MRFKQYLELCEKLITFNNRRPKFNHVVIMAGGSASGKGFIIDNLVGIEGRVYDTDQIKTWILKSEKLKNKIKKEYGVNFDDLDLENPDDVSLMHRIVKDKNLDKNFLNKIYAGIFIKNEKYKPNLIFDVTLKDIKKLKTLTDDVKALGYPKENIHLVWVINDIETAIQQNFERSRRVHKDILQNTHENVSQVMKDLLTNVNIRKYLDGDVWFVFNKKFVDSILKFSGAGGSYIKDVIYFKVKETKKGMMKLNDIADKYVKKIRKYVPNPEIWRKKKK